VFIVIGVEIKITAPWSEASSQLTKVLICFNNLNPPVPLENGIMSTVLSGSWPIESQHNIVICNLGLFISASVTVSKETDQDNWGLREESLRFHKTFTRWSSVILLIFPDGAVLLHCYNTTMRQAIRMTN
jgi:hypothetical protein